MNTQPNPIAIELKAMADRLRELFPESPWISFMANRNGGDRSQEIALHQIGTYADGQALMRRIGIGEREKSVLDGNTDRPWSILRGEEEEVTFTAYCSTIPPSCRIETVTKRIPKTATVDTGEFIEVQERIVKCGQALEAQA